MSSKIILLTLLFNTLLAQPGQCSCWLMFDVSHPHPDGHPERAHSHNYLFDLFQAQVIVIATLSFITAQMLIASLQQARVYLLKRHDHLSLLNWLPSVEPPPPRMSFARKNQLITIVSFRLFQEENRYVSCASHYFDRSGVELARRPQLGAGS